MARRFIPIPEEQERLGVSTRDGIYRRLLGVADATAALCALVVVAETLGDDRLKLATLLVAPLVVLIHKIAGLYERDELVFRRSTLDEAPQLFQIAGLFAFVVTLLDSALIEGHLSRWQSACIWLFVFMFTGGARFAARRLAGAAADAERCLVIGDILHANRVREKLASTGVPASVVATLPLEHDDVSAIGGPERLRDLVSELDVHRVVIAPTSTDAAAFIELIRIAKSAGVRVSVMPRMFEVVGSSVEFDQLDGLTLLGVRRFGLTRSSRLIKRVFDIGGATVGLLAISPVMAALAVAIRLDSRGPIFFRQTRVGRDGKEFQIIKFRSMVSGAEELKDDLREINEVEGGMFKITDDPRVTRVGRFLRRTSLDELPQLFNVLKGEMSLVGPRPLVVDEDNLVNGLDRLRLHLTPGMTGPWQILGSTRVPLNEMVGIDYLYVANWTLWTDIKILIRTVTHVLGSKGL
jgi:exopolysaccharide biosynthesis polyprenyl glycosylphosphotransferase